MDASAEMVAAAARRLGDRAEVWCQDVLYLELDERVDVVVSTAAPHWVIDHDRLWVRLAQALRPGGVLEVQCGGVGNIRRVREVIALPKLRTSATSRMSRLRARRAVHVSSSSSMS